MKNIFKYPLKATEWQFVSMPEGAEILCVQAQRETPCLWALVDPAMAPTMRKIHVYGTGHDIPDNLHLAYIGTFQLEGGTLVFHAFEAMESGSATEDEMSNFHGRIMNIRDGADGAASIEYKRGHRDARHATAEIANEADSRIAELKAQLAAAQAELTRLRSGGCAEMQEMVGRLTALAEEWDTEDCYDKIRRETLDWCAKRLMEAIAAHSGEGE